MASKDTKYDHDAHRALTEERAKQPEQVKVFTQASLHPLMNPYGISPRECRFSPLFPNATGMLIWCDVTGSMGTTPEYMVKVGYPEMMRYIYTGGLVPDPQPLIGGVGDAENPNYHELSPLQMGQFEGEAHKMDECFMRLHLEGQGGRNAHESYDLPFVAAVYLTSMDCHEKHGRKGYNFIFGDEPHAGRASKAVIKERLGIDVPADIPMADLVAAAGEKFHNFFIIPNKYKGAVERCWRDLLGDRVIVLERPEDCAAAIAALIGLTEGTIPAIDEVASVLSRLGCAEDKARRVVRSVEAYASSIGRGGASRPVQS